MGGGGGGGGGEVVVLLLICLLLLFAPVSHHAAVVRNEYSIYLLSEAPAILTTSRCHQSYQIYFSFLFLFFIAYFNTGKVLIDHV